MDRTNVFRAATSVTGSFRFLAMATSVSTALDLRLCMCVRVLVLCAMLSFAALSSMELCFCRQKLVEALLVLSVVYFASKRSSKIRYAH